MDRSAKHDAARFASQRLPALEASLALLVEETQAAEIVLYGTARPAPGEAPGGDAVVVIPIASEGGSIDGALYRINLSVPIEGQVVGADPTEGTDVLWGRIRDGVGDWWADASVSDTAGTGEIKMQSIRLYQGAFCRLVAAAFQG